jgi:hypothetical protein
MDAVMEDSCMRRTTRSPCKRAPAPWHLVLTGRVACETCGRGLTRPTDMSTPDRMGLTWRRSATDKHIHIHIHIIRPLAANRRWMENKSASCLSDHLRRMSVLQHAEANPIFLAAANHSSPFRPPPYLRSDSLTPTCVSRGNSDPSPPGNGHPSM